MERRKLVKKKFKKISQSGRKAKLYFRSKDPRDPVNRW